MTIKIFVGELEITITYNYLNKPSDIDINYLLFDRSSHKFDSNTSSRLVFVLYNAIYF